MKRFTCPRCKVVLQTPDNWAGTVVGCPHCKQPMQVPNPASAVPHPIPPSPPRTLSPVPVQSWLGVLMSLNNALSHWNTPGPAHGQHGIANRHAPARPLASRGKERSWLMTLSLIFLILAYGGCVLLVLAITSLTDDRGKVTDKLAALTSVQGTPPPTHNESVSTPTPSIVLDRPQTNRKSKNCQTSPPLRQSLLPSRSGRKTNRPVAPKIQLPLRQRHETHPLKVTKIVLGSPNRLRASSRRSVRHRPSQRPPSRPRRRRQHRNPNSRRRRPGARFTRRPLPSLTLPAQRCLERAGSTSWCLAS
jgi:hypothetical protein